MLAEAEAARFGPSLRSRGIDPAAARQVALLRDELLGRGCRRHEGWASAQSEADDDECSNGCCWLIPIASSNAAARSGTGVMVGGRGVRLAPNRSCATPNCSWRSMRAKIAAPACWRSRSAWRAWCGSNGSRSFSRHHVRRERLTRYDESRRRVISTTELWYHDLLLREDVNPTVEFDEAGPRPGRGSAAPGGRLASGTTASRALARAVGFRQARPAGIELARFQRRGPRRNCWSPSARESRGSTRSSKPISCRILQSRLTPVQNRELQESAPQALVAAQRTPGPAWFMNLARRRSWPSRLQELFGWTETPRVARGRVPVLLHMLGPNNRPVQITDDLRSFWTTTYHQVRKDLRRRYPKHAWPEDPFQAPPSTQPKRPKSS